LLYIELVTYCGSERIFKVMRFLINVIESIERHHHSQQELAAINTFNEELMACVITEPLSGKEF